MALPSTGPISFSQINTEIKRTSTNTLSLNDATVRSLAGKASGKISMADLRGKSYEIRFVNSTNRTAASIFELMGSPTTAGNYIFENTAVISAGTSSYALRTGTFPAGSTLTIINKGTIRGKGGNGGTYSGAGGAGGTALYIDMNCTLDNSGGTISGGGGGGAWRRSVSGSFWGNAGGGGGAGVNGGGAGGTSCYTLFTVVRNASAGSATGGGTGGAVRFGNSGTIYGGTGGALGAAGGTGSGDISGSYAESNGTTGAAGRAIQLNGKTVTITNAGTRHGATS